MGPAIRHGEHHGVFVMRFNERGIKNPPVIGGLHQALVATEAKLAVFVTRHSGGKDFRDAAVKGVSLSGRQSLSASGAAARQYLSTRFCSHASAKSMGSLAL